MSLDRVSVVTPTAPVGIADYQAIIAQLEARLDAFTGREIVDGSNIRAGAIVSIGGVAYKATSDTAITGTPSAYVKITPAGATASAAFVANPTGVAWSHTYGGYYDGSGSGSNLVIFDEALAYNTGVIASKYQINSRAIRGEQLTNATVNGAKIVDATVNGGKLTDATVTGGKLVDATVTTAKLDPVNRTTYSHYGEVSNTVLPSLANQETSIVWITNSISGGIESPSTGTYDYVIHRNDGVQIFTGITSGTVITGSSVTSLCIMYSRRA